MRAACDPVALGVNRHHEGERIKRISKMLAASATLLALGAFSAQAATADDLARRLEPVGKVCVQGQACTGAVTESGASARAPDDVIANHCTACHSVGLLNAPKIGDAADWGKRAQEQGGLDGLLAKAITGVNAMPPKGTCGDCSDDELKGAIEKMSGLK
ncbi:Cytochrome c5 [Pseudomonas poae]|uniref:Cytochrome c5 n=2 Tax=Pseudomonas poae TaxID=200451 RepID=A0ABY0RNR6_9PSED|nr:Cytochrome c5 [Pseudomonas poae]